jgi:glycosyltransferase involved in cell wall biosynthesis
MRILFTVLGNSRRSNYLDGDTLRYGNGGGSGTDTSSILVAEYLASQGHDVVIALDKLEPALEEAYAEKGILFNQGKKVRGVIYTDFDFTNVPFTEYDVLINSLWFQDYNKLPKITKAVIYWCHMQWIYGIGELVEYTKSNNLKLGFIHISEWEKSMNKGLIDHITIENPEIKTTLIPNPIMDDIINEVSNLNLPRKPHKFIFHASWARGGNIAFDAINQLDFPDKEFHAFDYLMTIHDYKEPFFHRHDGVDKKTLFTHIAESEYFVYPLYTPYQDVHKDTFSCVVAEAIALGAIVITYPLGALPENFNDYCIWLPSPEGVDIQQMQGEALSKDLDGKFKCTDNIINTINHLEQYPHIKEDIRRQGKDYILNKFNINMVGDMWVNFINDLVDQQKMKYNYINKNNETLKIGIYSVYFPNNDLRYRNLQKLIFNKFNVEINQIEWGGPMDYDGHPNFMNEISNNENVDYLVFFDIDAFPLKPNFLNIIIDRIYGKNTILGIEQKTSHLNNEIYAGSGFFCISKEFYNLLGNPKYNANGRSDVVEELSHICREKNYEISFLKFDKCEIERWELKPGIMFGNGSIYEDLIFHNFHSASGGNIEIFINNANKVLEL